MAKGKKVVKFHRTFRLNMAVIVFLVIFFYMLYNIFRYFTTPQVAVYEVSLGSIAQDTLYTGAIVRDEKIFYTEKAGYINYYNRDASRVGVDSYVYSIDGDGSFYRQVMQQPDGQLFQAEGSYDKLEETAENFVLGYSDVSFHQAYCFQQEVVAELMEAASANALSMLDGQAGDTAGIQLYKAPEPGIVVYNIDGLEGVTLENFDSDLFDQDAHEKNNLISREQVAAGDAAYKMITSEAWSLVVPIDEKLAKDLERTEHLQVRFKKDDSMAWGASAIVSHGEEHYLTLSFQDSSLRFATDRYLEIELASSEASGLKIPTSALTKKKFFLIPKGYYTTDEETGAQGVLLRRQNSKGETVTKLVEATIIGKKKKSYYIAGSKLEKGEAIVHPKTGERYLLQKQKTFWGVYNINRGYAVFRRIKILAENNEYTVVDTATDYGISLYDHIALDASAVREYDILQQ